MIVSTLLTSVYIIYATNLLLSENRVVPWTASSPHDAVMNDPSKCVRGYSHQWNKLPRKNDYNYLPVFWMAHLLFQLKPSAWKKNLKMERGIIYTNLISNAWGFWSLMKIGEEGKKTFTNACITLMSREKRTWAYISMAKVKTVHFWGFKPVYG